MLQRVCGPQWWGSVCDIKNLSGRPRDFPFIWLQGLLYIVLTSMLKVLLDITVKPFFTDTCLTLEAPVSTYNFSKLISMHFLQE